jgi:hypothetical protein
VKPGNLPRRNALLEIWELWTEMYSDFFRVPAAEISQSEDMHNVASRKVILGVLQKKNKSLAYVGNTIVRPSEYGLLKVAKHFVGGFMKIGPGVVL